MKTTPVTPADLVASILALPPLANNVDETLATSQNLRLAQWLQSAGVTTFLYGGCANFFNAPVNAYAALLDAIEAPARADDWVIPSIGPDYGKARDQIAVLRERDFPTAMLLPLMQVSAAGVATGIRRLADFYGRPLMVFFKSADYARPRDLASLLADGALCCVEYGIAGSVEPEPFLTELLDATGSASQVIDGSGERTIVGNARHGVVGFTSGSGVVAPHLAKALLKAVTSGDLETAARLREHFLPLEQLRQSHGPIPVLHEAVRLAGIADTGPISPFFANVTEGGLLSKIEAAALALKARSLESVG
ncbi:MAG: hypothetical protein JWQ11_4681 [Rhizobacter sp.]|nr:hypothetical protein [Rhizobacter sp.]